MPLNFPTSPSTNDEYSFGGKTWVYNGAGWALKSIPLTTANVNESGNLYYTDARVYANVITTYGAAANTYVNTRLATKANVADKLNVFASTTSSELASVISDETGSGSLVFATSPTLAGTPQAPTAADGTANAMIATTAFASNASNLSSGIVNPSRIAGSYTGITGVGTITTGVWQGSSISTTYTDAKITSVAGQTGSISNNQLLSAILAVDGVGSTLDADLLDGLAGGGSGFYALKANNLSVFASTTSAELAGVISDETGSGSLVFATSPTFAGTPQAPTAADGTANAMIATTAFAANASNLSSGIVNPSRISGSYTSITGVGTINTGVWQGSSINTTYTDAKVVSVNGVDGTVVLTTANINEQTNLYFSNARAYANIVVEYGAAANTYVNNRLETKANVSDLTTANVLEVTNLYFTNARSRAAISAGTGVSYDNGTGVIAIGQSVGTTNDVTFANVVVTGNLLVQGNSIQFTSNTLLIEDPLIQLGINPVGDTVDLGFVGHYFDGSVERHAGLFRDATDGQFKLFANLFPEPDTIVNTGDASYQSANLVLNFVVGKVTDISNHSTTNLTEGTNLYFNNTRARSAISQGSGITYTTSTGVISANVTSVAGQTGAISNNQLLSAILAVDGSGSTLDADLLDGLSGGGSGAYALKANNLSVFDSTTSAQLAGVISDETGSGNLVFATSPTLATPRLSHANVAYPALVFNANLNTGLYAEAANVISFSVSNTKTANINSTGIHVLGNVFTGNINVQTVSRLGTVADGIWNGSSISTTYTDAKITSITASTPISANSATGAVALSHANSGVVAGTYGNAKIIPVVTVNATGHVTGVSNVSIEAGSSVTVSNTAPVSATEGDLYWDKDLGKLFIYYNDGDSSQWVDASPSTPSTDINFIVYGRTTNTEIDIIAGSFTVIGRSSNSTISIYT